MHRWRRDTVSPSRRVTRAPHRIHSLDGVARTNTAAYTVVPHPTLPRCYHKYMSGGSDPCGPERVNRRRRDGRQVPVCRDFRLEIQRTECSLIPEVDRAGVTESIEISF